MKPRVWFERLADRWLTHFKDSHGLHAAIMAAHAPTGVKTLLHVACGHANLTNVPLPGFHETGWRELRIDADQNVKPDIVGSMVSMAAVPDDFAEAIFSSHGIEHLYWHDVPLALAEFHRVLKDDGFAVTTCPDVQAAAQMIAQDRMFETAYQSAVGPITPFDILYSYRPYVQANPQWMAHHCGFTISTLMAVFREAGFESLYGFRRPDAFDLWLLASKRQRNPEEMAALAKKFLIATA